MNRRQQRATILFNLGATVAVADELLAYTKPLPATALAKVGELKQIPMLAEPHLAAWQTIAVEGQQHNGILSVLQKSFFQLRFPIKSGISQDIAYQRSVRGGDFSLAPPPKEGLTLKQPEQLRLVLYESLGGLVPVLLPNGRSDFVTLVQAFGFKNEPEPIPEAMGAAIISGVINWGRLHQLRTQWLEEMTTNSFTEILWRQELQHHILPHKQLYQDTFIILGDGHYSQVAAWELNLSEEAWRSMSYTIRLVHEATHYLMRRLNIARPHHLLDELIADLQGIVAANGRFQADWFLRFMGLEEYPHCRETGRLHLYRGSLSKAAFALLQRLIWQAAHNLEHIYNQQLAQLTDVRQQLQTIVALANLTLEELATLTEEALLKRILLPVPEAEDRPFN